MKRHNSKFLYLLKRCITILGISHFLSYPLAAATVEAEILSQIKVAGQAPVIVTLHDPVSAYLDSQKKKNGLRGSVADDLHRQLVAQAQTSVLASLVAARLRADHHFNLKRQYSYIPALAGTVTAAGLTLLRNHPEVASIRLDKQHKLALAESKQQINVDAVHALPYTGKGITVAVLDSGIDTDHPDLADSIVAQHCFTDASCPPFGTNEGDSAEDDIYGGGHGTSVAGIITAPYGVAPDAGIIAIKVSSHIGIFSIPLQSDIMAGLDWIRAHLSTQPVQLINLSLGGGSFSNICDDDDPAYNNIFKQLREQGVTIFAGAGNDGSTNQIGSPACLNNAIAVGATDTSDQVAYFSNSNYLVDILAPGVNMSSSLMGGGRITFGGTSAATPMAAGVAALMLEANPTLTPPLIKSIMRNTGVIITDAKNGLIFPRVDALAAVNMAPGEVVAFAVKGYKMEETGGAVTIEVSRFGSGNGRVSVDYVTVDESATAGNDYIATSGTLVWEEGDTSHKSFVVTILDDSNPETFEETFLIALLNPIGHLIGDNKTQQPAIVTILDNDAGGRFELTGISDDTRIDDFFLFDIRHGVNEESGSITIEVARQETSKGEVKVDYATMDGTATAGSDYIVTQGSLTWGDADKDNKEFTIPILDDTVFEGKETFTVLLSNPTGGATLGDEVYKTVVIADNEYGIGITDGSFESGNTYLPHPVWNSGISGLVDSPILANSEQAHTGHQLMILGGILYPTASFAVQRFIIPVEALTLNFWLKIPDASGTNNDFLGVLIDGNEHFVVTDANATDYADYQFVPIDIRAYADGNVHDVFFYSEVFGNDETTTTFFIDDVELAQRDAGLLWFTQTHYTLNENSGLVTFEVARILGSRGEVSVNYMISDESAQVGVDYTGENGTLTWQDGDTNNQSFTVTITDDAYFEKDKTFKLRLFNPTGGASTALAEPATVMIINDDAPMVGITDGSFELGTPNPVWTETDSFNVSPICSSATCGPPDFPTKAHTGEYFAWFGSAFPPRSGSLEQTLIIPVDATALSFWLQMPSAESPGDLQVSIDNTPLFGVTEADVATYSDYTQVMVDISAYADGGIHTLRFESNVVGGAAMRFFVDDVALISTSTCPATTSVPEIPQFGVTINGYHAQATWTSVTNAQGYIFSFAPYSNPISAVTLNQITAVDLGTQSQIAGELTQGAAYYVAVQAYNCAGKSPYSNLGVIIIP